MSSSGGASQPLPRGFAGYRVLLARNANMRNIWFGQVISQLGDWFNTVALLGLLVDLTHIPASASLTIVTQILPSALAGLFISGVAADHFDRKKIMIAADLARAAIAVMYLFVRSPEQVWMAYAATIGLSLGSSFFQPAFSAALPNLVSKEELPIANALGQSTFASMLFVGAMVGGVVTQLFGRDTAFILNALSFVWSAFFIWRVKGNFHADQGRRSLSGAGAMRVLTEGFRYLKENKVVRAFVLAKPAWGFGLGAVGLYSVYALNIYKVGDIGTSWLYAGRGVGAFIGPFLVTTLLVNHSNRMLMRVLRLALVVAAAGYFLFGLSTSPLVGVLGVMIGHIGGASLWTFSAIAVQRSTPDDLRGRVLALDGVMIQLVNAFSNLLLGVVATLVYPEFAVFLGVGLMAFFAAIWMFSTKDIGKDERKSPV